MTDETTTYDCPVCGVTIHAHVDSDAAADRQPCEDCEAATLCPDCGRPITLNPSGWWSHDGLPNGCWRLSLDGPNVD